MEETDGIIEWLIEEAKREKKREKRKAFVEARGAIDFRSHQKVVTKRMKEELPRERHMKTVVYDIAQFLPGKNKRERND